MFINLCQYSVIMEEPILNPQEEVEVMVNVKSELNNFLHKDSEDTSREPDYADPTDVPAPKMLPDGRYQIPGTNKVFETNAQAYAAIARYKAHAVQNGASLLIFGMSFSEFMGEQ